MSGATTREMREQIEAQVLGALTKDAQPFGDILVKVQRAHFPATVGWATSSLDRTVGKWVRAALQRLRKAGRAESVGKGQWKLASKGGES
jgi:hypothetical protein